VSDLERFWLGDDEYGDPALVPASDGDWVRFSDAAERDKEARELKNRLKGFVELYEKFAANPVPAGGTAEDEFQRGCDETFQAVVINLRSLLDSGEESNEEACTNCDGTGTRFSEIAWDELTCGRCNGNKVVPAGSQEGKFGGPGVRRPSGSPALHREGREDGCRVTNLPASDPDPITREQIEATAGPSAVTTNDVPAPGGEEDENAGPSVEVTIRVGEKDTTWTVDADGEQWAGGNGSTASAIESAFHFVGVHLASPAPIRPVDMEVRAALSVIGSGKVEVNRDDLAEVAGFLQHMSGCSLVKFPMMKGHSCDCAMGRLRAVLEQEGGEGE